MTRDDSETTSIEQRTRMVERQLRRRGIHDERVLAAMAAVPRERFVPGSLRRRAYRDGALRIGEGQTISQPWIVACMAQLLELEGGETVLEVGTGSGYGAAVLSLLCERVVSVERFESLAAGAAELLAALGYDNVEVRVGDGSQGAPDRAPFGGISVTATARERPAGRAVRPARARRRARLPGAARPPRGAGALPRRQRGGGGLGALRAAGERRVIREFSAGGVVIRRMRGRPFVAVVRVRDEILALPKGHPDQGESSIDAARREVREETGLETEPLAKLGDIRYWYVRDGERVMKIVSFFLFRYLGGSVEDHDDEVEEALWIPLAEAPERLAYKGEREMAGTALSRLAQGR